MTYHKVKDHEGLLKDTRSGAILLSNQSAAREYQLKKQSIENDKQMAREINNIKERLSDLEVMKTEISDIKSLLLQIANNGNK